MAFATETVYGLGADATNPDAVARIFEAKGRPPTNPLIVHVADKADALDLRLRPGRIGPSRLADRFWPGPLTMVLPRSSIIPDIVTAGQDTVGRPGPLDRRGPMADPRGRPTDRRAQRQPVERGSRRPWPSTSSRTSRTGST